MPDRKKGAKYDYCVSNILQSVFQQIAFLSTLPLFYLLPIAAPSKPQTLA